MSPLKRTNLLFLYKQIKKQFFFFLIVSKTNKLLLVIIDFHHIYRIDYKVQTKQLNEGECQIKIL